MSKKPRPRVPRYRTRVFYETWAGTITIDAWQGSLDLYFLGDAFDQRKGAYALLMQAIKSKRNVNQEVEILFDGIDMSSFYLFVDDWRYTPGQPPKTQESSPRVLQPVTPPNSGQQYQQYNLFDSRQLRRPDPRFSSS